MAKIDNKSVAMAMLRCCAWMWEHCTKNSNEGEFKLNEVVRGMDKKNGDKSAPGITMVEPSLCKYWDVFNQNDPIDGLTFFRKEMYVRMDFDDFHCSYYLCDVFSVAYRFCRFNCPSIAQKVRFCYKEGERWMEMEETKEKNAANRNNDKQAAKPQPTFAEMLRAALKARLAA